VRGDELTDGALKGELVRIVAADDGDVTLVIETPEKVRAPPPKRFLCAEAEETVLGKSGAA
jgi:hypothetical protein